MPLAKQAARAATRVAVVATLALAGLTAPAIATASGPDWFRVSGVASWDVLWIRSAPSSRASKVGSIPADGTGVRNLGCEGRWCRVEYRGVVGWSHGRYLRE